MTLQQLRYLAAIVECNLNILGGPHTPEYSLH